MHHHRERGQVAPLLALLAVGVGLACLGLGRFGADAVANARARTAADAAALASAATGAEIDARRLAQANGATVESYEAAGADVRVRVRVDTGHGAVVSSARARRSGSPRDPVPLADPNARRSELAPALRAALARAEQLVGEPIPITSGFRSPDDQRRLWLDRATNPYPVAPPGTSMHERGLAVDVPRHLAERVAAVAARAGLCRPYPATDPVHFEPC